MIKSYGLHWRKGIVDWGKQNVAGKLMGAASRKEGAIQIDFRDQIGIYALYADYELVYIGQTGRGENRLLDRIRRHKKDHLSERWDRFSWFGVLGVTRRHELSRDAANVHGQIGQVLNVLEAVTTAISEPRLNLQRGRWGNATQYFQTSLDGVYDDEE